MVHEVAKAVGLRGLLLEDGEHLGFGETILFPEAFREKAGKQCVRGIIGSVATECRQLFGDGRSDPHEVIQCSIGHKGAHSPVIPIHLEVGGYLLEGKFEGVADVVKECRQSPEAQKAAGGIVPAWAGAAVGLPIGLAGLVDGQAQGKNIDRVGVVVSVFHQQTAAVGFKFREQLDHPPGLRILPHEHLQVAEVDVKGVLLPPGAQEAAQGVFQAQSVHVHLLVIGNLPLLQTGPQIFPGPRLLRLLIVAEAQILAALPKKCQRRPLQAEAVVYPRLNV